MIIGGGHRHIPEAGHAEHIAVPSRTGDGKTPQIVVIAGSTVAAEDTKLLKDIATDIYPLMTRRATIGLEQLVATLLFGSERLVLATQVLIETRIGRD